MSVTIQDKILNKKLDIKSTFLRNTQVVSEEVGLKYNIFPCNSQYFMNFLNLHFCCKSQTINFYLFKINKKKRNFFKTGLVSLLENPGFPRG